MNNFEEYLINVLLEAQTPERHGHIIANKALNKFDDERDAFEKSGGKVKPTKVPGFWDPNSENFMKASEYDKAMDKEGEKGPTAEKLRKKRLTTQLKLKNKLRKRFVASRENDAHDEALRLARNEKEETPLVRRQKRAKHKAAQKRIDRMHSTQDKRGGDRPGWRGEDETDAAQRRGQPYPGGTHSGGIAPWRDWFNKKEK